MKKIIYIVGVLVIALLIGCEDYINGVDPLIEKVEDERLNTEGQIRFQITGVQQGFSTIAAQIGCQSDLLSDALEYNNQNPDASFPQFEEINIGIINLTNASVNGTWNLIHSLRFMADTLGVRANQITFSNTALKNEALFTANFYGAVARFYIASSFALTENQPGGCFNAGPFIPAAQILDEAIAKAKAALTFTSDAYLTKVTNSFLAKIYLAKLDYTNAAVYAALGLVRNDNNFTALHADNSQIYFWGFAGNGRHQIHIADRFNDYIKADPKEAARLPMTSFKFGNGETHYFQNKYPNKSSSYIFLTWKENNLMLAELALRGYGSANALNLVNEVRTSYSIDPLTSVNLDVIYTERDKELFCQGTRLMDQHRFNKFHLSAIAWKYLPIPQPERDANPNF